MRISALLAALLPLVACTGGTSGTATEDGTGDALTAIPRSAMLERLAETYSDPESYGIVQSDAYEILASYGLDGAVSPACATFYSTALGDLSGVRVPRVIHDGSDVRINTTGLGWYLQSTLGWSKLTSHTQLERGDAVFTRPATANSTHPAHVYLFNGWIDNQYAWIIDNQAAGYCDESSNKFVGYCDADGGGSDWCCRGPGLRQWKRSVTADIVHTDSASPDTDQRMWYALRAAE